MSNSDQKLENDIAEELGLNKELDNKTDALYDEGEIALQTSVSDIKKEEQAVSEELTGQSKPIRKVYEHSTKSEGSESVTSCGNVLKQVRVEQGLSLETIHEATKIPMDALRAIEEGYKIRSLSPFYYNGFVKIYAAFLGLNPADVLGSSPKTAIPRSSEPAVSIDFDVLGRVNRFLTRRRKRQIAVGLGFIVGLLIIFKLASAFSVWLSTRPKSDKKIVKIEKKINAPAAVKPAILPVEPVKKNESPSKAAVLPKSVEPVTIAAVSTPVAKIQKNVVLTVRAAKKSWLRVMADNAVVFQANLSEDAVETWQANDKIEISGNNLNLLEFELNGKLIGKLGRKDRKAKAVVITKDGLTTK